MKNKRSVLKIGQGVVCVFVSLVLCLCLSFTAGFATEVSQPEIKTLRFSAKEFITNSFYFQDAVFEVTEDMTFEMLMEQAAANGYIKEYRFEDDWLCYVLFANGTSLSKEGYGAQSGFHLATSGTLQPPYAKLELLADQSYMLQYKISPDHYNAWLSTENNNVTEQKIWNESWEATLDSACDWLYYNRTRGSKQAITALGVAKKPANPTDVVLLTQMVGVNPDDLSALIQTIYAAAYSGYSHPTVGDQNLFMLLQNYCSPDACMTDQLCSILRLYDAFDFEIDTNVALSRGAIVGELLERVNDDGGFSRRRWRGSDIASTADAIAALQQYRDLSVVDAAVLDAISYLSSPEIRDELYDLESEVNCTEIAKVIIAMNCCNLPFHDVYFTKDGMTYADLLLQYMSVSGGFAMQPHEVEDEQATSAAVAALCSLKVQGNPYSSDAVLVSLTVDEPVKQDEDKPANTQPVDPMPFLQIKGGFWLALGSVGMVILTQILRFCRKKKRDAANAADIQDT